MSRHSAAQEPAPNVRERFVLNHAMEYEYDRPVTLAPHVVRLVPQGWVALDSTAGTWASAAHVPLAVAAHPRDAGPLQGTFAVAKPMPGVFAKSTLRFKVTLQSFGAGK